MNYVLLIYGVKLTKEEFKLIEPKVKNYEEWIIPANNSYFIGIIQKHIQKDQSILIKNVGSPTNTIELISVLYQLDIKKLPDHHLISINL